MGEDQGHFPRVKDLYSTALASLLAFSRQKEGWEVLLVRAELARTSWKMNKQDHATAETTCRELLKMSQKQKQNALEASWSATGTLAEINAYLATVEPQRAAAYMKQALDWQMQVVKSREKVLGGKHPRTMKAVQVHASYLESASNLNSASR